MAKNQILQSQKIKTKFHHIGIHVVEIKRSKVFYESIGFKSQYSFTSTSGLKACVMKGYGLMIELLESNKRISSRKREPLRSKNAAIDHLAFVVDNVPSIYKELSQRGFKFTKEPKKGASCRWYVFLLDPDNNPIELYQEK